jgi:NAD(P)H-dependent flavin oxidoreductase YrpB (nitropropane dioxygenase family)
VVKNKLAAEVLALEERGATLQEILVKMGGGRGKIAYDTGDPEMSPLPSGQIAGLINDIKSVREVVEGIISEAFEELERLSRMAS